ncbi:hypothetical protein SH668x_000251 [Planctomicrobium sp. SH668]|uniref:hypothetical protein n=1 Tax=Planctomicrobium sp. SH668 TaxID=3448126 RepID=UPI003F5C9929
MWIVLIAGSVLIGRLLERRATNELTESQQYRIAVSLMTFRKIERIVFFTVLGPLLLTALTPLGKNRLFVGGIDLVLFMLLLSAFGYQTFRVSRLDLPGTFRVKYFLSLLVVYFPAIVMLYGELERLQILY